jgi:hypothetical protein
MSPNITHAEDSMRTQFAVTRRKTLLRATTLAAASARQLRHALPVWDVRPEGFRAHGCALGIQKDKPFAPDERMKANLACFMVPRS